MSTLLPRNFVIDSQKIILRPFCHTDKEKVLEIIMSDEVKKTYMLPDFESREAATALFDRLVKMSASNERFVYAIDHDNTVVGMINEVDKGENFIELGYAVNPAYKNQGFATAALSACITELKRMGYKIVRAGYFEENIPSRRVMEKCGMKMTDQTDEVEYRGKIHKCCYFEI